MVASCRNSAIWELHYVCGLVGVLGIPRAPSKNVFPPCSAPRCRLRYFETVLLDPVFEVEVTVRGMVLVTLGARAQTRKALEDMTRHRRDH